MNLMMQWFHVCINMTFYICRFMWRTNGAGEVYAYLPEAEQRESLCQESDVICNPKYGYSLGRGSWTFARGKWVTVRQTVRLNTPGVRNGMVRVDVNWRHVYTERRLAFVSNETGKLLGIGMCKSYPCTS